MSGLNPIRFKRRILTFDRRIREARMVAKALKSRHHPILAHVVPMRRCNLSCTYCNEYDNFSKPVPTALMKHRIELLGALGTSTVTLSGGEPLLHPQLDEIILCIRRHGMIADLITNGYLLTPERIRNLNHAGLDHLQLSIDNVLPNEVSKKSLKVLDRKLQWLATHAEFDVNINSVLGCTVRNPDDALIIACRARELGFQSTVGLIHDGSGQLRQLDEHQRTVFRAISNLPKPFYNSVLYRRFYENLAQGRPNDWHCRAGSRYLYICEDGLVHYCSQQRGHPGFPLEEYTRENLEHEYHTVKSCVSYCTIPCVQRVAIVDEFRERPREALVRLFPVSGRGDQTSSDLPTGIRVLTWLFLPPNQHNWRHRLTSIFTRATLLCLKVK